VIQFIRASDNLRCSEFLDASRRAYQDVISAAMGQEAIDKSVDEIRTLSCWTLICRM
jgi:hypothetical protein